MYADSKNIFIVFRKKNIFNGNIDMQAHIFLYYLILECAVY